MYYEARQHEILPPCENITQLLEQVKTCEAYQVPTIKINEKLIGIVCDGHINSSKDEIAIIDITNSKCIESLTWAWIHPSRRYAALQEAVTSDHLHYDAIIPTKEIGSDKLAMFECGCCGAQFQSTINEQKKYDQDAGYGICLVCSQLYYSRR